MELLIEIIGWIGAGSLVLAYVLVSSDRLSSHSPAYQLLNVVGALGFIVNGWVHHAFPSVVLNVVWLAIAAWFLLRCAHERANRRRSGAESLNGPV